FESRDPWRLYSVIVRNKNGCGHNDAGLLLLLRSVVANQIIDKDRNLIIGDGGSVADHVSYEVRPGGLVEMQALNGISTVTCGAGRVEDLLPGGIIGRSTGSGILGTKILGEVIHESRYLSIVHCSAVGLHVHDEIFPLIALICPLKFVEGVQTMAGSA